MEGGGVFSIFASMRLLLFILLLFTQCSVSPQRYISRESHLYPNIYDNVDIDNNKEIFLYVTKDHVIFEKDKQFFTYKKEKFLERRDNKVGYLEVYKSSINEDDVILTLLYTKKSLLLSVGIRRGMSLMVFIINYETKFINEIHR